MKIREEDNLADLIEKLINELQKDYEEKSLVEIYDIKDRINKLVK